MTVQCSSGSDQNCDSKVHVPHKEQPNAITVPELRLDKAHADDAPQHIPEPTNSVGLYGNRPQMKRPKNELTGLGRYYASVMKRIASKVQLRM